MGRDFITARSYATTSYSRVNIKNLNIDPRLFVSRHKTRKLLQDIYEPQVSIKLSRSVLTRKQLYDASNDDVRNSDANLDEKKADNLSSNACSSYNSAFITTDNFTRLGPAGRTAVRT